MKELARTYNKEGKTENRTSDASLGRAFCEIDPLAGEIWYPGRGCVSRGGGRPEKGGVPVRVRATPRYYDRGENTIQ